MNVQRFRKLCSCKYLLNAQKYRTAHQYKTESEIEALPKEEARVSQIANGIKVASVEDNGPLTQVSVVIKAGSRYENPKTNSGIVHCLRNAAVLSTRNHTGFALTRSLEMCGAKLSVSATRDHLFYNLKCSRDDVDPCLEILSDVTCHQVFKPWEVSDMAANLKLDLALFHQNPAAILNELLHKAAYRGGLSNSLYSPTFMIDHHSPEMLHHYVQDNFTTSKTSIVALGIPHDHLQSCVNELFHMSSKGDGSNLGASKFTSGEIRHECDIDQVHTAIVAEGAGYNNHKDVVSLSILECMMGCGSDINLSGTKFTKLGAAAAKCATDPVYVSTLNLKYSDTGLFGVYVVGNPDSMNDIVKAVVSEMKQVSKNITDSNVEIAKHKLKAKWMIDRELSTNILTTMAIDTAECGRVKDNNTVLKEIDSITASDVQAVAGRVVKAKPAMASVGRLHATPHVDELL